VTHFDASLHRLPAEMVVTMRDAPGIGLAANQIGVLPRSR
jgi:peptide deformylase